MACLKGCPVEIISTYTHKHNLGEQPRKYFAGNAQKTKVQDGRHTFFVYITIQQVVLI